MPDKATKAWAVVVPRGGILQDTVMRTRSASIHATCLLFYGNDYGRFDGYGNGRAWRLLRNDGYRCVRVEIKEVQQ